MSVDLLKNDSDGCGSCDRVFCGHEGMEEIKAPYKADNEEEARELRRRLLEKGSPWG